MIPITINATGGSAPYDLTNVTNTENIVEFIREVNNLTGEWFMMGMLFAGFVITFMAMKGDTSPKDALVGSGFMVTVIGIFFFFMEFITAAKIITIVIIYTIIFAISMFLKDQ